MNERQRREAAEMRLRDYFERIHAPIFLSGAKPGTLKRNRESLNHWERVTSNSRILDIDTEMLAGFKSRMFNPDGFSTRKPSGTPQRLLFDFEPAQPDRPNPRRPLSRGTVNCHLRQVLTMLNKAGPPGPKNRDALGILKSVPWTHPLKELKRKPRNVKDDLLESIYRATAVAVHPKLDGVSAEHWWKGLIVTAVTVGYRREGLLGLPWDGVDWEASLLRLPPEDDKCGEEREKSVHPIVLQHLLRIRTAGELVFPFPESESTWYRQWWAIQDAAGIAETKRIKFHDLKRACGTRFAAIASLFVVQQRLDHASIATAKHYVNATDEEREAVKRFPVPAAFLEDFGGDKPPIGIVG